MPCAQPCGDDGDFEIQCDDRDRKALEEIANGLDLWVPAARWAYDALCERRGCHCEPIAILKSMGEHRPCRLVVHIVAIEETNDDAGVEVDQSHSPRNFSSSSLA